MIKFWNYKLQRFSTRNLIISISEWTCISWSSLDFVSPRSEIEHLGISGTGFYQLDALLVTQPTESKHCRKTMHRPHPGKSSTVFIITDCASMGGNAIASIHLSIFFHSIFWTNWPLALIFCTCVGHYHGSQMTETESHRSRSRCGRSGLDIWSRTVY